VALFVILGIVGNAMRTPEDHARSERESNVIWAYIECKESVRARLKAPSTADFAGISEVKFRELNTGRYEVGAWVDAQNSFGAKIRTLFMCTVSGSGSTWRVESVNIAR
jgi:hypothetical protein